MNKGVHVMDAGLEVRGEWREWVQVSRIDELWVGD